MTAGPGGPGQAGTLRVGLLDLALVVALVAVGLGAMRALGRIPQLEQLVAIFAGVNLPFLLAAWVMLVCRPVPQFRSTRRWLLIAITSAILCALVAVVSPLVRA